MLPKKLVELEYLDLPRGLVDAIESGGNFLFWIVIAIFAVWVFARFFAGLRALRWTDQ